MPGGDRTGPAGMGPMTGRAAGFCAGYGMPGYMNAGGRGLGMGFGRGGGFGGGGRGPSTALRAGPRKRNGEVKKGDAGPMTQGSGQGAGA